MIILSVQLSTYLFPSVSSVRRSLLEAVLIVHGNHLPIIIFSILIAVLLANCKRMRSKNGLPKNTPTNTMISLYKNSPANIAVANFHGLYFARPSVMYIRLPEIGVIAAINAPIHPYLLRSFSREDILPFVFLVIIL